MTTETIISIFLGIGLAASVGFRVFLPLFALSLAAYFDVWSLNGSWEWIGSLPAVIVLGVAMLVEIFAYFIPWVDNLLDSISVPLAGIAGTLLMAATQGAISPLFASVFNKEWRTTGCAFSYSIGNGIAGAAPLIAEVLSHYDPLYGMSIFILVLLVVGMIGMYMIYLIKPEILVSPIKAAKNIQAI